VPTITTWYCSNVTAQNRTTRPQHYSYALPFSFFLFIMTKVVTRKYNIIRQLLIASAISIVIGTLFLWTGSHSLKIPLQHYIWNAGYSLCLGLSLFSNGLVFNKVEQKFISWKEYPVKSVFIALFFHLAYSSVVIFLWNWLWFIVLRHETLSTFLSYGWFIIIGEYIVLVIVTAIIYAKSFFREWLEQTIQGEKLKQEAIALQYQVMQNQVNPHFLFNSLNALGSLIDIDPQKAKLFTRELSMFYRELLYFKDKELIPLNEELQFVQKYIFLQKIRFENNFDVSIQINEENEYEIIPMSLQMMIENAIKHNIISKEKPLKIVIGQTNNSELFVENNLQLRENVSGSNHIGIKNLMERYRFLTGREIVITRTDKFFRVTMPLIDLSQKL
jgi:two-component system, LytTR family, sensor kinase